MNFQEFVDKIEPMTCIISVEKLADGSYGNIRLAAGNKAYIDSIENPQHMSSSSMLHNKFIPGSPYEKYIPKEYLLDGFNATTGSEYYKRMVEDR